jgi:hypothetical protein
VIAPRFGPYPRLTSSLPQSPYVSTAPLVAAGAPAARTQIATLAWVVAATVGLLVDEVFDFGEHLLEVVFEEEVVGGWEFDGFLVGEEFLEVA